MSPEREKDTKAIILVVDDTPDNIDVLSGILRPFYKVKAASSGEKALQIVKKSPKPDMILLDIMMPGMDGYEVCEVLKSHPETKNIPVIFITAKIQIEDEEHGLEVGAVDYITKPISPPIVLSRIKTHLALYDQNRALEEKVKIRTQQLTDTRIEVIHKLGKAAEYKDNETGMHVIRMSHYSRVIAEALNIDPQWAETVFHAAPMHDIGKIGIPDGVLLKPGKLDQAEWKIMQSHSAMGADILGEEHSELLQMAAIVALNHHEKWNGKGYPNGLKGEDIPLPARIVAVADVFDALTSERPYKKAWTVEDATNLIREESGEHFDPKIAGLFLENIDKIIEIKNKYAEGAVKRISSEND